MPQQKCQTVAGKKCQQVARQVSTQVAEEKCQDREEDVCVLVPVPKCSTVQDTVTKQVTISFGHMVCDDFKCRLWYKGTIGGRFLSDTYKMLESYIVLLFKSTLFSSEISLKSTLVFHIRVLLFLHETA